VSFVESVGFAGVVNLGASSVTIERLLDEVGLGQSVSWRRGGVAQTSCP
jgi:hypothetical protein